MGFIRRIWRAVVFALAGLRAAFATQWAFRVEVACAAIALPVAFLIEATRAERALLVMSVAFILAAELANTAIEMTLDRVSKKRHPLAGKAKDVASAIVFMSLCSAALVWGLVLFG